MIGASTPKLRPPLTIVADPAATTLRTQSALVPYGSAISTPSAASMMSTGVSYVRPLLLPVCRMSDVWVPADPAVRITRGFVTVLFIRRTASSTGGTFHRIPATSTDSITTANPTIEATISPTARTPERFDMGTTLTAPG